MFADHDGAGDDGGDEEGEDQHHDDHPQVLQVKAVDGDRGIRNPITYSITGGPDHLFAINKLNGLVYVNVTLILSSYFRITLSLEAILISLPSTSSVDLYHVVNFHLRWPPYPKCEMQLTALRPPLIERVKTQETELSSSRWDSPSSSSSSA